MGSSSSKAERRERRRQEAESRNSSASNSRQPTVIPQSRAGQQQPQQQQTQANPGGAAPPPIPPHLQQYQSAQFQQQYQQAQYNAVPQQQQQQQQSALPRQDSVEVKEGEKVSNLATVDRRSVHYEPETSTLMFEITNTVPCTYEVHVAVRETVSKGAVIYSPNKPKNPPVPILLDKPYEAEPCAVFVELEGVSTQEQTFVKQYPKQMPIVIVLKYTTPEGHEQSEHTDIALLPKCEVFRQLVVAQGHVYEVEHLFGADHTAEPTVAEVMGGGEGVIDESEDDLCVICITEAKNTAVIPCRHLCLCKGCAEELKKHSQKCPVCRGPISQLLSMK